MSSTPARESSVPPPSSSPGNPMQAVIDQVRSARSLGLTRSRSQMDDLEDEGEGHIDPMLQLAPTVTHHAIGNFVAQGRAIKRQKKFNAESERDFEEFIHSSCPGEHMIYVYSGLLECRDLLKMISHSSEYRLPETLRKTVVDYAVAYILSPAVLFYKKKSGPPAVLAAMRTLNIGALPPAAETGRCEVVLTVIGKAMIDARHLMKDKISGSIKNDIGDSTDIASLTQACIGNAKAKLTAALLIRIAFLRWVMVKYPKLGSEKYWDQVDKSLAEYRHQFSGSAELQMAFKVIYDEDVAKYGSPDTVTYPLVASHEVDSWLRTVNNFAGAHAPVPTVAVNE